MNCPTTEILRILAEGYGRPFGADWFQWKHLDGPWGPSRPIVARDESGPLGVVFGLPWRFRVDGSAVDGIRLVDGATTPRAVRRGVFRRIVRELIDPTDGSPRPPIVIATATPEAQGAHVKNGAVALEPIDSTYRPTLYSTAALETGPSVIDDLVGSDDPERRRRRSGMLRRCDGAPNHRRAPTYHVARLAQSDTANGVVYRLGPRRTLILTARWGPERERTTLAARRGLAGAGDRRACVLGSGNARAGTATRSPSRTVLAVRLGSDGPGRRIRRPWRPCRLEDVRARLGGVHLTGRSTHGGRTRPWDQVGHAARAVRRRWRRAIKPRRWWLKVRCVAPLRSGVTVVIVNWETLDYLRETVRAVRRFSPAQTRILVVDNGSTDGSAEWLRQAGVRTVELGVRTMGAWKTSGRLRLYTPGSPQ